MDERRKDERKSGRAKRVEAWRIGRADEWRTGGLEGLAAHCLDWRKSCRLLAEERPDQNALRNRAE